MKAIEDKEGNIFRILSAAISEGIIIVNEEQKIVASNEAANFMFGYERDELVGTSLDQLIPREYKHTHTKQVDQFMENNDPRQMGHGRDLYGLRKDGNVFPLEAGLNPFNIYNSRYVL